MFYSRKIPSRLPLTERYKIATLVFLGTILAQVAIDIYTPSMPIMQIAFETSKTNIQLSLTYYLLGYGALQLLFGYLSDKYGRRPTILFGYAGFLITTLFIIHTQTIFYFLLLRFIQGCFASAFQVAMRTSFRDIFHGRELSKVAGIYSTIWALVPVLAPTMGGYIQYYFGWHMHFYIIACLTGSFFVFTWHLLPETKPVIEKNKSPHVFHAIAKHLKNKQLLLMTLFASLSTTLLFAYITVAPFLLQSDYRLSPIQYGWSMFIVTVFNMAGAFTTGKLVMKLGNKVMISLMLGLHLIAILLLLTAIHYFPHSLYSILIPIAILFYAEGAMYPAIAGNTYDLIKTDIGIGMALYGTILSIGYSTGLAILAHLPQENPAVLGWFLLTVIILLAIMLFITKRKL